MSKFVFLIVRIVRLSRFLLRFVLRSCWIVLNRLKLLIRLRLVNIVVLFSARMLIVCRLATCRLLTFMFVSTI